MARITQPASRPWGLCWVVTPTTWPSWSFKPVTRSRSSSTPRRRSSKNRASMISAALSETGKTRFPRSTFNLTPRSSKKSMVAWASNRDRALYKNLPLRGMEAIISSSEQWLVTLHRPFPVMYSLRPTFSLGSTSTTWAPPLAAEMAAIIPAAPAPTTITLSLLTVVPFLSRACLITSRHTPPSHTPDTRPRCSPAAQRWR